MADKKKLPLHRFQVGKGVQLRRCKLCEKGYNILAKECPYCGLNNDQFFNMPIDARESYVEFFHDREVYVAMAAQAVREGMTTEALYKKAAEEYLTNLPRG